MRRMYKLIYTVEQWSQLQKVSSSMNAKNKGMYIRVDTWFNIRMVCIGMYGMYESYGEVCISYTIGIIMISV